MKVTIIQLNIEWGSSLTNIGRAERLIAQQPESNLYVLPEMWSTGFATEPKEVAETEATSCSLTWMKQMALSRHCALCGSLAVKVADGTFRNRHYFIDGCNAHDIYSVGVSHYDKHHLFTYGGENKFYTPGKDHAIVEYCGFRILLLTCYDLRFPIWSRYANNLQFDIIICVANWPSSRQNAWQILTRARAIENQAYFIGCNRVGNDQHSHYIGMSSIISPIGKTLISCKKDQEQTATYMLNLDTLIYQRAKFQVLKDRDIF